MIDGRVSTTAAEERSRGSIEAWVDLVPIDNPIAVLVPFPEQILSTTDRTGELERADGTRAESSVRVAIADHHSRLVGREGRLELLHHRVLLVASGLSGRVECHARHARRVALAPAGGAAQLVQVLGGRLGPQLTVELLKATVQRSSQRSQ